ncbi:MAG: hypothetical protein PVG66_09210 [Chromatiales bacterium]
MQQDLRQGIAIQMLTIVMILMTHHAIHIAQFVGLNIETHWQVIDKYLSLLHGFNSIIQIDVTGMLFIQVDPMTVDLVTFLKTPWNTTGSRTTCRSIIPINDVLSDLLHFFRIPGFFDAVIMNVAKLG